MSTVNSHKQVSGLSGNEIFCLDKVGYRPGQLCFGNSVMSLGVFSGISATLSNLGGGEVEDVTQLIHEARERSFERMLQEVKASGGNGVAGVSFDVINHAGQIEFITVGSAVHHPEQDGLHFSTSASGQELYCQLDSGFTPKGFVFGNIAYSIGVGGSIKGVLNSFKRGEVPQYSKIFDHTRHASLERIKKEAKSKKANAVVGIVTSISPFMGTQEMMMLGTASEHPALNEYFDEPVTSNLNSEELWNVVNMGFMPIKLVMGVSVYSIGFAGGVTAMFKSLGRGEIETSTQLLHEARDKAFERIQQDTIACNADEVIGVKTFIYDLGNGLIECLAIGTAVKKMQGITTKTQQLLPQALTTDKNTFFDNALNTSVKPNQTRAKSASKLQSGAMQIVVTVLAVVAYGFVFFHSH